MVVYHVFSETDKEELESILSEHLTPTSEFDANFKIDNGNNLLLVNYSGLMGRTPGETALLDYHPKSILILEAHVDDRDSSSNLTSEERTRLEPIWKKLGRPQGFKVEPLKYGSALNLEEM